MHYTRIVLSGKYQEIGPQVMRLTKPAPALIFRFDLFYEKVEHILRTRSIRRVLVERRKGFSAPAFGGLEEIRAGIERLRKAGKEIYYYAAEYDASDCVLSAACNHRIMHPLGQLSFRGMAMPSLFFKKFLDKHDIDVTIIRRGKYKGAADRLRTEKFDDYSREQYQALMTGVVSAMRKAAATPASGQKQGGFSEEILDKMLEGRIYTATEALENKMVDQLTTLYDLIDKWKKKKIRERIGIKFFRFRSGSRLAVLVFEGMIADGANRNHPLFGQVTGDSQMIKRIRALRKNKRVKGVVFRINSGGGSPTASENILKELAALHREKPLVISMGPVAGSGGYWLSTTGRRLFALPTTLTGSIGVITLFFNLAGLLEKHGITTDCIKEGDSADMGSAFRSLTDKEHSTINHTVDYLYQAFIDRVAESRKMTREKIHELGQGRLWLGIDAVQHKLVDQTGGLHDAINHLKDILNVKKVKLQFQPRQPLIMRIMGRRSAAAAQQVLSANYLWKEETDNAPGFPFLPTAETLSNELNISLSLAQACLSVHGRLFLHDPLLIELLYGIHNSGNQR